MKFNKNLLAIDPAAEAERIVLSLRQSVQKVLRRYGAVVGVSGGVDSAVVLALCVRAFGPAKVIAVTMPDQDSSPQSEQLAREAARQCGVEPILENVTPALQGFGCYRRRDEAVRSVVPEYGEGWRCKIVLPDQITQPGYAIFSVVVRAPSGEERRVRLPLDAYLGIVAATNFKQRVRKMMEYYYADRYRYAVAGTANLLEHDQGFFVKLGDGAADLKPIAHLYKSQVYQLAEFLGVPETIRRRQPTTDTYPLEQSQEEFYFSLSLEQTDLCIYARDRGIPPAEAAPVVGLTTEQVTRAFQVIDSKREAARYLHAQSMLFEPEYVA